MTTEIENAIKLLASKITAEVKADDALKYTQAALNLAHARATIAEDGWTDRTSRAGRVRQYA